MRTDRGVLETVGEKDIDLLVVEEFHTSAPFREWFLEAVGEQATAFLGAWRSVTRFNGESDVEIAIEGDDGDIVVALVENKIRADEQPRQAERYRQRGRRYVEVGTADRFLTCIIAPDGYLDDDLRGKYDQAVTYEQLRSWFSGRDGPRYDFKETVVAEAIELGRERYVKSTDEETQAFWRFYESLATNYPQLEFSVSHTPASGTNWFRFTPTSLPDDAMIIHKADRGAVDLSFDGRGPNVGQVRTALDDVLDDDMHVTRTGKSASVRVRVAAFEELSDPTDTESAIRKGLGAAARLLEWERENRERWTAVPRAE